jgi:hypothetical protein
MNEPSALPAIDAWLQHRGRHVHVAFMLQSGERGHLVELREGRIHRIDAGPFVMPRWSFRLRADAQAWQLHWGSEPTPGFHDLMAMIRFRRLVLEGDPQVFMCNLLYFKELVRFLGKVLP